MEKEWFRDWFNSEYYHILYQQHNEKDARAFIDVLLDHLKPPSGATVLDLACGKGRHSRYLATRGLSVTGIDLSESSITYARQFENEKLSFFSHDMRKPFRVNYFDYIFNLFTSFGYFQTDAEHLETLINIHNGLKMEGVFVLDYFNSEYIKAHLKPYEEKIVDSTTFFIEKRIEAGFVFKKISFDTPDRQLYFEEQVRLFSQAELTELVQQAEMKVTGFYGNHQLQTFDPELSPRLILLCHKM